ncbi:MAG TPA: hypothetical protein VHQ98_04645 [Gaiellaceae bacterium]|nr:hypothetical protein [Gaiellaceae bacterium]
MAARLRKFVKLWIDLFAKHALLDHASAAAFSVLKALVPLTLLGLTLLGALGQERVWEKMLAPGIEPQVKTAAGNLTVFLVLSGYVYTSAIIFLVGVELDEPLREDATEGQRGVLGILGIAR